MFRALKIISLFLLFFTLNTQAKSAWVSDSLRISVYKEAGLNQQSIGTLNAGDKVEKLENSRDGKYIKIKRGKLIGWVAAYNLMDNPSVHSKVDELSALVEQYSQKNDSLNQNEKSQTQELIALRAQIKELITSEQQAKDELNRLQHASSNVVLIDKRNRELEALLAQNEQYSNSLRNRINRLEEALHERQIYVGALLIAIGFILAWLLEHFRANKNRNHFN